MKRKSLAIILLLTMLMLAAGSAYPGWRPPGSTSGTTVKAHPWEEPSVVNGPSPCSATFVLILYDHKGTIIPVFSDFLIWIFIKDIRRESDPQKNSVELDGRSYQIIFPW